MKSARPASRSIPGPNSVNSMKRHSVLLLLLLLSLPGLLRTRTAHAQIPEPQFETINNLKNLPYKDILCLYQDPQGYIWIGTGNGLYRFNGYNTEEFRSNMSHPDILAGNRITCMTEDREQHLYIGTSQGLSIIDKKTGRIRRSLNKEINKSIASLLCTSDNKILIGTNKGLYRYDIRTDSCTNIFDKTIKGLLEDSRGDIWIGTWSDGLFRYQTARGGEFIRYPKMNRYNSAHVIFEDSRNRIWVGSYGNGITLLHNPYDLDHFSWTTYDTSTPDNALSDDYVYTIQENRETGMLWVGTRNGISIASTEQESVVWKNIFASYDPHRLKSCEINTIINDLDGNIWIGTSGSGVYYVKTQNYKFRNNELSPILNQWHSSMVRALLVDGDYLWLGIGNNGLYKLDRNGGILEHYNNFKDTWAQRSITRINTIGRFDDGKRLLVGTLSGLYIYRNRHIEEYKGKELARKSINQIIQADGKFYIAAKYLVCGLDQHSLACTLLLDRKIIFTTIAKSGDTLWVGSESDGIFRIPLQADTCDTPRIKHYSQADGLTPTNDILHLAVDSKGRIWAGTNGAGLCLYDERSDSFLSINSRIDFPTDYIASIGEDDSGAFWLGSNNGLIKFDFNDSIRLSRTQVFNKNNGLADDYFTLRAVARGPRGEMIFGTHQGYVAFQPREIKTSREYSRATITDIKLNNISLNALPPAERDRISTLLPGYTSRITIPDKYNSFTIEFVPMTYTNPEKVRYAYRLDGYDNAWIYTSNDMRFAHYTNLPAGNYRFYLKATNKYGVWDERNLRTLEVRILPPPWKSGWACLLYALIVILLITYIFKTTRQKIKLRTEIKIRQIEKDKDDELTQTKLRFFTNITHELYTPITIIAAALEEVRELIPRVKYEIIASNTNRLIRLIQQILEFRKAETGNLRLQVHRQDLSRFIAKHIESFIPLMKKKNIAISFNHDSTEHAEIYFDPDKIDKILYNLLSNALKYNKEGNRVEVGLQYDDQKHTACISVADNGSGLSEKVMKNLFKRFYDGDFRAYHTVGTGIGLSLVHDLVLLHKGSIDVVNTPGKGVRFNITIPVGIEAYTPEECYERKQQNDILEYEGGGQSTDDNPEDRRSTILVVEDNPDLLLLIHGMLARKYNVFDAEDGKAALALLEKENIDLVVSDIMMPEMDGYELCRSIKQNINYNHIPVVLLTAKAEDEAAVEAYESGADGFITKPFSINRLMARINNLLSIRAQNISQFKKQAIFNTDNIEFTTRDEEFIKAVLACVNSHYSEPDFDQSRLAEMMSLSKSTLHRKLTSLIGMTAATLIKNIRLKIAREMLKKKGGSRVSEIAYAVGFNDPKYFSICFKKEYGTLPSNYEEQETAPDGTGTPDETPSDSEA